MPVDNQIEIETSTDRPEDVAEALGAEIEIDDTASPEKESPKPKTGDESNESDDDANEGNESEDENDEPEENDEQDVKPEKKPAPQTVPRSRLNEIIARKKESDRQLETERSRVRDLERQLADKGKPATTAADVPQKGKTFCGEAEPDFATYTAGIDPYDAPKMNEANAKFIKAHGEWSRKEGKAEAAFEARKESVAQANKAILEEFASNVEQTKKRLPDYDEVVTNNPTTISGWMHIRILKSPVGGDIAYYLAQNPDVAKEINGLAVDDQVAEIGSLERAIKRAIKAGGTVADLETEEPEEKATAPERKGPPKKTASTAPLPPSRIKSTGPGPKSEQELAGSDAKTGVDIDFNPDYEKTVKARKTTR